MHTFRLELQNDRTTASMVVIEPWAYDYTAAPRETVEIVARSASPDLWFRVVSNEDGSMEVHFEGEAETVGVEWDVFVAGVKVEIGHGRRA